MNDKEKEELKNIEKWIRSMGLLKEANFLHKLLNLVEKQEKVIDEMAERIEWLLKSNAILLDIEHGENFTQKDIKQYFYRKVENNE